MKSFSILLVFLGLHFVVSSQVDKVEFKMRIKERRSRFNELIRINEKENTVSFMVPKHNDVDRSEVRNDFNLNLTITRLPDVGICYIKPLDRDLSSPSKIKSDMNYFFSVMKVKNGKARTTNLSTLVSFSEWTFDKQLKQNDLSLSVVKFCAGLPVYSLKKRANDDNWMILQSNGIASGRNRQRQKRLSKDFQLCPESIGKSYPCTPDQWILNCKFVDRKTCVYWVKCRFPTGVIRSLDSCSKEHKWSSVVCCNPSCPSK